MHCRIASTCRAGQNKDLCPVDFDGWTTSNCRSPRGTGKIQHAAAEFLSRLNIEVRSSLLSTHDKMFFLYSSHLVLLSWIFAESLSGKPVAPSKFQGFGRARVMPRLAFVYLAYPRMVANVVWCLPTLVICKDAKRRERVCLSQSFWHDPQLFPLLLFTQFPMYDLTVPSGQSDTSKEETLISQAGINILGGTASTHLRSCILYGEEGTNRRHKTMSLDGLTVCH